MQWLAQKLLAPEDQTVEFKKEMRDSAKILVAVEMLLQPSMYVLGLVLGLVHSIQHSVWAYLPYLIQISTIIFSYWVQVKTLKKAPPSSQDIVEQFVETEKVVGYDTRVPKLLTHVAMNYSLYWAGMGATLVAGQSFSIWTHDDQGKWVKAWSQVPAVGDVTGVLFGWLSVPVILTIFAVVNYGILVIAYHSIDISLDMQYADPANLPLFSALLEWQDEEDKHFSRHFRLCLIAGAHIWVKTSLLAMSWQSSSRFEKANIMVPLFLTMGSKVYSQVQVYKNATCADFWTSNSDGTTGERVRTLFFLLFVNTPALFVTACVFKLVGIFACPTTHLLNLTSGCVE